ncbi:MAG: biotin/lipoate A/B protein ligase family protein [Burkholderiales bacterium]
MSRNPIAVDVVDTGLAGGVHNAAMDRACLERQTREGASGGALRFHRSRPTASIGQHQALDRELRLDYCRRHDIEIVRRPTSGGALYLDPDQLGFSLTMRQPTAWRGFTLARLLELGGTAVAAGLGRLGIDAAFKFPNDVEVNGRKIASVFATRHGAALLLHGSVLLDADIATMLKALRTPTEKLSADGLAAARGRLVTLNALCAGWLPLADVKAALTASLAATLGLELRENGGATLPVLPTSGQIVAEQQLVRSVAWDKDRDLKIEALVRTAGGTLRARAEFMPPDATLHNVEFATDAQIEPAAFLVGLQQALDRLPVAGIDERLAGFIQDNPLDAAGLDAADIGQVLRQLADKHRFARRSGLGIEKINALMPHFPAPGLDAATLLAKASVMLVPYCAKPVWCKWRQRDGCTECGLCEVGTAYEIARDRNMQVTTIINYEHLVATLSELKARRVEAYIGMCCSNFFIKRYRAFAEAGVPALLMDISGANCYELQQEEQAYAGTFAAQAKLDAVLLTHVMKFVPRRPVPAMQSEEES